MNRGKNATSGINLTSFIDQHHVLSNSSGLTLSLIDSKGDLAEAENKIVRFEFGDLENTEEQRLVKDIRVLNPDNWQFSKIENWQIRKNQLADTRFVLLIDGANDITKLQASLSFPAEITVFTVENQHESVLSNSSGLPLSLIDSKGDLADARKSIVRFEFDHFHPTSILELLLNDIRNLSLENWQLSKIENWQFSKNQSAADTRFVLLIDGTNGITELQHTLSIYPATITEFTVE